MMNIKINFLSCVLLMTAMLQGVHAAILDVRTSANLQTSFDGNILSNDLVNAGQNSLSSISGTANASFPVSGSNDGTATQTSGLTYYGTVNVPVSGVDLTYTLNTNPLSGGAANGYNIDSINSIYGWQDSRSRHSAQQWTVSVATISQPTFTLLYTVVYTPFAATDNLEGSTQVNLSNIALSQVTGIRFNLTPFSSPGNTGYTGEVGVLREFDIIGAASSIAAVPLPSSLSLFLIGGLGLLWSKRRNNRPLRSTL